MVHCATDLRGSTSFFTLSRFRLLRLLNKITERKRLDGGNNTVFSSLVQEVSRLWKLWRSLEVDLYSGLACFLFSSFVGRLTCDDFLLALGFTNVFDPYVDALFKDATVDELVDAYSDCRFGNVEYDAGASVVEFVWHTLVDGWVGEDIYVVANLDVHKVLGEVGKSVLAKLLGEHVPGTGTKTGVLWHGGWLLMGIRDGSQRCVNIR